MSVRRAVVVAPLALALAMTGVGQAVVSAAPGAPPTEAPSERRWLPSDQGDWSVTRVAAGTWQVSWRAADRLPVGADQPRIMAGRTDLGPVSLGRDGRTVLVHVRSDERPRPAELDVVLSGDRLDEPGDDLAAAPDAAVVPQAALPALPEDPATPGTYDVVTSDYELEPLPVSGMEQPIEMVGHVVEPAASAPGARPLVLFLHGRHSYCYLPGSDDFGDGEWPCTGGYEEIPSHLGYDYMQRVLASQGYATVSIRVNGINAQDWALADGGATARATVVAAHLDHWATIAAAHQVDVSQVVLVGHSRGGEGVNRASIRVPLSAPYRIVGQVLLAPTDFGTQTAPYVPTVTVLPYCDGDVSDLQGQRFTDVGRDLAPGDTSLKSSLLVMGANHNFFNTEWTPGLAVAPSWDDWGDTGTSTCGTENPRRLSPEQQQATGTAAVAGAVRMFARGEDQFLPLFDGSGVTVESLGDSMTFSHAIGNGRDARRPGIDAGRSAPDGAETSLCVPMVSPEPRSCFQGWEGLGVTPHWANDWSPAPLPIELELSWTAAGQAGGLVFDDPLDVTGRRLELRVATDPRYGVASFDVRLTDSAGNSATLTPAPGGTLGRMPGNPWTRKVWARTLVVRPGGATGVDLADITQVELVGRTPEGHVWLLDVAAAAGGLRAPQAKRLPYVDLGKARVLEGDGHDLTTASIPFRVVGTLTRPATFRVMVTGTEDFLGDGTYDVDLAPGQTTGRLDVSYQPDDGWGRTRRVFATAWGGQGVGTGRWVGQLRIVEDDPPPRLTVRAPRVVTEGEPATWTLRLSEPMPQRWGALARFVRGPRSRPPVRIDDVPRAWLESLGIDTRRNRPLHKVYIWQFVDFRRGRTKATITVPTRADGRDERTEVMTLKFRFLSQRVTETIRLRDS